MHLETATGQCALMAFRIQRNTREQIIKAKVAPYRNVRDTRIIYVMKKGGKCIVCRYVQEGNMIKCQFIKMKVPHQDLKIIYLRKNATTYFVI